ncbi:MAG: hypothetical protein GY853_16900 [PVC group bacterium]|nr:hypothetical protein [PVC group bacterium]
MKVTFKLPKAFQEPGEVTLTPVFTKDGVYVELMKKIKGTKYYERIEVE